MTNRKQSAVSRRQANRLFDTSDSEINSLTTIVNNLSQTTSDQITIINQNLSNVSQSNNNTSSNLNYQLNVEIPGTLSYTANDHEIRIEALENEGPDPGGNGGIDPTNPNTRVLFEDFLHLPDGNDTGSLFPYLADGYGNFTSGTIFNSGGNVTFRPSQPEPNYPGILNIRFEPVTAGIQTYKSAFIALQANSHSFRWAEISRITTIIKSPSYTIGGSDFGNYSFFIVGLSSDFDDPENNYGIYLKANLTNNTWQGVTTSGISTSTTSTAVYAANTWYRIDIKRLNTTDVEFYINNVSLGIITTNVPNGALNFGIALKHDHEVVDGSSAICKVDFVGIKQGSPENLSETSLTGNVIGLNLDFGSNANETTATTVVTGQAWVLPNSVIEVLPNPVQISGHTLEDYLLERVQCVVTELNPGVGFTVQAYAPNGTFGIYNVIAHGA